VLERFSPLARRVLELAMGEATAQQSQYVGSEHILMGLLKLEDDVYRRALEEFRITYPRVRKSVAAVVGRSDKLAGPASPIYTTRTTKMLTAATLDATKNGAGAVAPDHLLNAVIAGDGIGSHILADSGVTVAGVRAAISGAPPRREKWMRIRNFFDRF
jgi:ATP-dependent Clp protease ATP-binding subunit ClpC